MTPKPDTAWAPTPDPVTTPAAAVLDEAVETMPAKYAQCPVCEATLAPVPPHDLWRACRTCHPATFTR